MIALGRVVVPDLSFPRKRKSRFQNAQLYARFRGHTADGLAQLQCATLPRLPASKGRPPLVDDGASRPDGPNFQSGKRMRKRRNKKGVKSLKTNNPAKSLIRIL
jgi:hypothetical protein